MRTKILMIFIIFLIFLLVLMSLSFKNAHDYFFPEKTLVTTKPAYEYEDITLKTKDNLNLKGWYIPAENKTNKAIILAQGYPNNRDRMLDFIPFLHKKYNLLLFDFRALGNSDGKMSTFGLYEKHDILTVVEYLKQKNMESIGALGLSLGAASIIMSESPDIKAAVLDSTYATLISASFKQYEHYGIFKYPVLFLSGIALWLEYGINPLEIAPIKHIQNIDAPLLIIHGTKDDMVNINDAYKLNEKARNSEIWIVVNGEHVNAHISNKEDYEKRVLEFFEKNLK